MVTDDAVTPTRSLLAGSALVAAGVVDEGWLVAGAWLVADAWLVGDLDELEQPAPTTTATNAAPTAALLLRCCLEPINMASPLDARWTRSVDLDPAPSHVLDPA